MAKSWSATGPTRATAKVGLCTCPEGSRRKNLLAQTRDGRAGCVTEVSTGAPRRTQDKEVGHRFEIAIVGDDSETALLERDRQLEGIRRLQ